jgi:phage terminase large subunit GpA-like protein
LKAELVGQRGRRGRNTILSRQFPGGSLKIVAAKSPRNLRRHTSRILFIDEADGCETSAEGDPIDLATKRTLTFPDRKIILGSTPIDEETSHACRAYAASDMRVFECLARAAGRSLNCHGRISNGNRASPRRPHSAARCNELVGENHMPQNARSPKR